MALPADPEAWQPQHAEAAAERLSPAAQWYFTGQWVALDPLQQPSPPIWLAAPNCLRQLQLDPVSLQLQPMPDSHQPDASAPAPRIAAQLVPALASNPTFINEHTLRYLAQSSLRVRGEWQNHQLQCRTFWPESWRIQLDAPVLTGNWQQLIGRGEAGAQQAFACSRLWQRTEQNGEAARWAIGFMLNGAQGDDDEAHGGHFALTLGRWRDDGDIADWLVANFYNPDVVSEKGILPALVPMDNYLADLNSGQQQYRPSWLVTVVLADATIATALYQQLLQTLEQLYDHRLHYSHADNNCTGLSMDALRAIGIRVPLRGPSSRWLAPLLFLSKALRERSLSEARKAGRYLLAEQTRLLPWQAFAGSVEHLLALLNDSVAATTESESTLRAAAVAVYGLQFPQLPSARAWGREPLQTVFEFQQRVPARRADWKIIPVPARELPAALRRSR